MTARQLIVLCLVIGACTSTDATCFDAATREYVAARSLLAHLERAAETGYHPSRERLDFVDVSECGPTLEARKICTSQTSVELTAVAPVNREETVRRAARLRHELPALRAAAERAYHACMINAPAK